MDNYAYFKEVLPSLLKTHKGKFVVIKNKTILDYYDSFDEAFTKTTKTEEMGTFIIQECADLDKTAAHFAWNNVSFV